MRPIIYETVMFGGQRAGKSSMLASMYMTMEPRAQHAGLRLRSHGRAVSALWQKYSDLVQMPVRLQSTGVADTEEMGVKPTPQGEPVTYEFILGGPDFDIADLRFTDFAGEDIQSHDGYMLSKIDSADAVLVAINSPAMMEAFEDSRWAPLHHMHNVPDHFAAAVDRWRDSECAPDLVVLAPIKCERWMSVPSEIERLHDVVQQSYGSALSLLSRSPFKEKTAVCICPVQTVGSVSYVGLASKDSRLPLSPGNAHMLFEATSGGDYSPFNHEQPFLHVLYSVVQGVDYATLGEVHGASIPQKAASKMGEWWEKFKREYVPKVLHEPMDIPEMKDWVEKTSGLSHFRSGAESLAKARSTESPVQIVQKGMLYQ